MPALSPKTVGSLIRQARNAAGLTQAELAESASVSDETIRRLELGKYEPTLSTMISISDALGVPIERFTGQAEIDKGSRLPPLAIRIAHVAAKLPPTTQRALLRLAEEFPRRDGGTPQTKEGPSSKRRSPR